MGPGGLPPVPRNFGSGVPPVLQEISHFADRDPDGSATMAGRGQSLEPLEPKDLEQLFHGAGQKPASPCSRPDIRPGDIISKLHLHRQGRKRVPFRKRKSESGWWKRIRIGKGSAFQSRWAELTVGYTGRRPLQRRGTGEFSDEVPLETTADDCLVKLGGITRPRPFGWGLFLYTEGDNHGYTM